MAGESVFSECGNGCCEGSGEEGGDGFDVHDCVLVGFGVWGRKSVGMSVSGWWFFFWLARNFVGVESVVLAVWEFLKSLASNYILIERCLNTRQFRNPLIIFLLFGSSFRVCYFIICSGRLDGWIERWAPTTAASSQPSWRRWTNLSTSTPLYSPYSSLSRGGCSRTVRKQDEEAVSWLM